MNDTMRIYWANLCILNRMEGEKMEDAASCWSEKHQIKPEMVYLGDTEEIGIYDQLDSDIRTGSPNFDIIVSSRFDIFCSRKYLLNDKQRLLPIREHFSLRPDIEAIAVADPAGLFLPLVVLPHFIIANTRLLGSEKLPRSLGELLTPKWEGKVYLGSTELPSAKSVLFSIWYLYGDKGLEKAVRNWRQKSAPSAARHGIVKNEFPIAILPGVFGGPGPEDNLQRIIPEEGATIMPSYAAIQRSEHEEESLDFLKSSVATPDFIEFYRNRAHAFPAMKGIDIPDNIDGDLKMFFPPWEWIQNRDMDYFREACSMMPAD